MRITLLNQYYTPDLAPTAHLSASLAEHRAALGDEVRVLTSRGGYVEASDVAASESSGNLKVSRLWTPRFGKKYALLRIMDYAAFYLQTLLRMIFMKRQDVIITLTTPPLIGLTAVAHRILHPSTKIILWNMDCYPDVLEQVDMVKSGGIASRLLRFLVRLQFRWVDHLVTLDEAMSDLLLRQYEPSKRKLPTTVIPNWERSSLFPKDEQYSPWTPNDSEAFRDKFVVLYLGNTGYGHEFQTVVQAAEQLREDALVFLFVGGGKRWQMLEQAKREKNLDNFILHGYVPKEETPQVMNSSDCALITLSDSSLGIMSPSKMHSNLACGLPILYLGPQGSNVDEAIETFDCGESVRHGEVDRVVAFLRRCVSDDEYRTQLKSNARKAFDSRYCDDRTLPMFDAIIEELVQQ